VKFVGSSAENIEQCGSAAQPAVGIRARAHSAIDAIGFVCDKP
jgi:hypothetical protein